jgi:hypothetical protein
VDQPDGDGAIRKKDMVQLKARTPVLAGRSPLWSIAKYDVTLLDSEDKVVLDYDTLYANETPSLDDKLFERMLLEIHKAGPLFAARTEPLENGTFAKQSLRQALENTNIAELKSFVDYAAKYPGGIFGKQWKVYDLYALWVYIGTPSE